MQKKPSTAGPNRRISPATLRVPTILAPMCPADAEQQGCLSIGENHQSDAGFPRLVDDQSNQQGW